MKLFSRGCLTRKERKSYIAAVHCLASKQPGLTDRNLVPGARSRYDDFVVSHIQNALLVHFSGAFLPYHRRFVWLYEQALRSECGYTGAQPYWDWSKFYDDPRRGPVLDGSDVSMGSDGVYIPNREPTNVTVPNGPILPFPPGEGGGCLASGPFTADKWEVRLGPIGVEPKGPLDGLGFNPRCLTRDIGLQWAKDTTPTNITKLLDGCQDLGCFNLELDSGEGGVHTSGHFQVGGPQLDVWASPSDPIFWLHHAQIDRLWAIWQHQDAEARVNQVWGTETTLNIPPSANVTLDTKISFGAISGPTRVGDMVSTIDGDFCYIYG